MMLKKIGFICVVLLGSLICFSQAERQYIKNTNGDVVVEGKLEFPTKSNYSKIFLKLS